MELFDEDSKKFLKEFFDDFEKEIVLELHVEEEDDLVKVFSEELERLSNNKIKFNIIKKEGTLYPYTFVRSPWIRFLNKPNINFIGLPNGKEFLVFLEALKMIEREEVELQPHLEKKILYISKNINILVMTTPFCPYCVPTAINAIKLSFVNNNINSWITLVNEYKDLINRFNVSVVPKVIVLDESEKLLNEWEGNISLEKFVEEIL